ncbi:MAG TPA: DUF4214 domain-containing protein [Pyrinomonadaceae bacterium]|nr:DUF4214 domain-containing protein [Pyrinomonadaceae bacterium]
MRRFFVALSLVALLSAGALAQGQSAPTLRVVTEDPTLPSELFYGDVKVKPVRMRPGTNQRITIEDSDFFVQQQYIDFLSRFPEPSGFQAWMNVLSACNGDPNCLHGPDGKRVEVSRGFYQSHEYHEKGFLSHRFYAVSFGRLATYDEFTRDMRSLTGQTAEETLAKRAAFASSWVQRADFRAAYDSLSNAAFVDKLLQTAGVTLANRDQLVAEAATSRAAVLRKIVDSAEVQQKEYDPSFVAIQYYGYLRRAPETTGYNAWLSYLRSHPGDYKTMVWGFLYSQEYVNRF